MKKFELSVQQTILYSTKGLDSASLHYASYCFDIAVAIPRSEYLRLRKCASQTVVIVLDLTSTTGRWRADVFEVAVQHISDSLLRLLLVLDEQLSILQLKQKKSERIC